MTDRPPEIHVKDPDGNDVMVGGSTVADRAKNLAELEAKWSTWRVMAQFVAAQLDTSTIKEPAWDFIDKYTPFPVPGSQGNSGSEWPQVAVPVPDTRTPVEKIQAFQATLAARIEILRTQQVHDELRWIKTARAFDVLFAVARSSIERDPTLTPPPDR